MKKKLPYLLAVVLPFLVVWPLSVILLPQAQTKMHLWVIGIALGIVLFLRFGASFPNSGSGFGGP